MTECNIITNSSDGLRFFSFCKKDGLNILRKSSEIEAKALSITPDGLIFAVSDGDKISVRNAETDENIATIDQPRISKLAISPDAKILCTYTGFRKTPDHPEGQNNLHVFDVASGQIIDSRVHVQSENWRPQWSLDSQLCVRMFSGEIHFYPDNDLGQKPAKRLSLKGMRHCSLSKSTRNRHIAVYTPCQKSLPATVNVYAWRDGDLVPLANKSFFRADTVSLYWSDTGASLLVLAATKTSDTSYYGDQMLHFLTTSKSGDSATVPMPRKGPIHQVLWKPATGPFMRPLDEQFVVCQGSIPSAVTVFNVKCEALFTLGTGPWNQINFNPQGNILLAGGFGSLNGTVTVWDYVAHKRLSEFSAQNSTYLSWLPDGEHLVTAITTPRLRVNNGFSIWHYSGRLVAHEVVEKRANPRPATLDLPAATEHELYQVLPRPVPADKLPPPPTPKVGSAAGAQAPVVRLEKPKVYVPPALRNRQAAPVVNGNATGKGKKEGKGGGCQPPVAAASTETKPAAQRTPEDIAKFKQINYINKKLADIEKLKAMQKKKAKLEQSQLEKMAKEAELRKELAQLQL